MFTFSARVLLAIAAALLVLSSVGAAQAASLTLGTSNTSNASTILTGNSSNGPELKVVNTNATQPALLGQGSGASAGAFGVFGMLTTVSPSAASAAVRGQNNASNGQGYGVWGSQAGAGTGVYDTPTTGTGVYGRHLNSGGTAPGVEGDSASTAANASGVVGKITPTSPGAGSAGVYGLNNSTSANGYGVFGRHNGAGAGVYGLSNGQGVLGRAGTASSWPVANSGVRGDSSGSAGVLGTSENAVGVIGQSKNSSGVYGVSGNAEGMFGISSATEVAGVHGYDPVAGAFGVRGDSFSGTGVRGESQNFQGVSGSSVHNAGVYGETTGDGFAGYFNGPTEQHGPLNVYGNAASISNGSVRIARDTGTFSATGAALQAEHAGTNGEAAWFRIANAANGNAVLRLVRPTGTGDFLNCYQQGTNAGQVCHVDANGTFVSGSDFAESLPAQGARSGYGPGDVLSMSRAKPGQVVKSRNARDRALIGVYSTRPAVLGADKRGITRVGRNEVPVAITGIVPVKVTAANGSIYPGDLLTSSNLPGRAMNAGRTPAIGTVLGKALGVLEHGSGTIRMLVMLR